MRALPVAPDSARPTPADPPGLSRPAKAALWGLLPGGGQVYNRDYWKVPLVYAALGGVGYSVLFNHQRYQEFAEGYRLRTDGDDATTDAGLRSAAFSTDDNVKRAREFYRRNRDLSIIGAVAVYGLSIAEAVVDAHLATFDVNDDLSLRLAPTVVPHPTAPPTPALSLTLSLNRIR